MNFADAFKKRINPSARENTGENIFKFLNDEDLEKTGDYCWNEPILINTFFHYGII